MNNMEKEQMFQLARIVYQGEHDKVMIIDGQVCYANPWVTAGHPVMFNPSLTGEDWQVAQACRVIVAAFKLPDVLDVSKSDGRPYFVLDDHENQCTSAVDGADLLEASAKALIASRGKG